jgi:hypothetical protein
VLEILIEVWLSIVIVSAFIPVFVALNAEHDLIRMILEMIARLFS